MDELIKKVIAKTGISESLAKMAVDVVISQLKSKLPAGVGSQIDSLLGATQSSKGKKGSDPLSDIAGKLGGLLGKK
ncbi:MAG: hypothetical protein WC960_07240 [Bacteroidales bacterium]